LLESTDEKSVRSFFDDEILSYYEKHIRYRKLYTEGFGENLIFYGGNEIVPPEEITKFLEEGFEIFNIFSKGK
jgi:hypothetical protein